MMGQTHLALGAAVVSTVLLAGTGPGGLRPPSAAALGLLAVGLVATLFPDLDAPDSELAHAPRKLTRGLGRTSRGLLGLRRHSLGGALLGAGWGALGLLGEVLIGSVGRLVQSLTGHRGLTHELRGWALFSGLVGGLTLGGALSGGQAPAGALRTAGLVTAVWALGYLVHLLADAATPHGIPLLGRPFHLLPRGWRVRTGSVLDVVVIRGLAWGWVGLLLWTAAR